MDQPVTAMVMKCCVCGRVRDETGWRYRFVPVAEGERVSHGFCEDCYENEMMKMQWESQYAEPALYQ